MLRTLAFVIAVLTFPVVAQAQNCLPKPSAVAWLEDFTPQSSGCGRVDYLFYPRQEAWYCGGSYVLDFAPGWTGSSSVTGRIWYFEWYGLFDYRLWPTATLFCRCNVASCQVQAWR